MSTYCARPILHVAHEENHGNAETIAAGTLRVLANCGARARHRGRCHREHRHIRPSRADQPEAIPIASSRRRRGFNGDLRRAISTRQKVPQAAGRVRAAGIPKRTARPRPGSRPGSKRPARGVDHQSAGEWAANYLRRPQAIQTRPSQHGDHVSNRRDQHRKFRGGRHLKVIDLATGRIRTILDSPSGVVRDLEVSFDGQKILFSMRSNRADDYHLCEIRADGSGLRQLTFGAGLSDIDPIYLPDGRICFTSTREPKYCMCNRHIMGNLHTMDADGSNLQQIGHNTLHEGHASLLPDGRILYDRWEYVDRNFGDAQGVWTVNPDGTNHVIYWKNNTNSPGAVLDARAIPGTERFICVFGSCHDRPWGGWQSSIAVWGST